MGYPDSAQLRHPIVEMLSTHSMAPDGGVRHRIQPRPNRAGQLQVAIEAWLAESGRDHVVHGLALPPHYGGVTLHQLLHSEGMP